MPTISIKRKLYQFIYRIFYRSIRFLLIAFRFFLPSKMQKLIDDRKQLQLIWRQQSNNKVIWFHCASGEIEYIKPLLRKIRIEKPQYKLFLTYFSPSGKPMAHNCVFNDQEADGYAALPWDEVSSLEKFINQLRPAVLIISRTDLWPELLWQCRAKSIPSVLVAATFAPGSKKMSWGGKVFLKLCLPLLSRVYVVSEEDLIMIQNNFSGSQFFIGGDPRYDQVEFRINKQNKALPENIKLWAQEPLFIAGSTWPEDESVLLDAFQKNFIQRQELNQEPLKLIIVPHETDERHLHQLSTVLKKYEISFQFFSQTKNQEQFETINEKIQVLIFDQKGYLLDLYRLTSLAFIGGSFKKQIHSVMEALGQGARVVVGPYYQNNREAIEFQKITVNGQTVVQSVQDANELANLLVLHFQMNSKDLRELIQKEFQCKTKATDKTFGLIKDLF